MYGLNDPITSEEILQCVKNLKSNKAAGCDEIVNEYLSSTVDICLPIYVKLFNLVFNSGVIPEMWITGIVKPIYKNKGDKSNPDNYRGITLLSCLGKLFTAILNTRLTFYADCIMLLTEAQTGFRKGYSTSDNIFVLSSLIEFLQSKGKKCIVLLSILRKLLTLSGEMDCGRKLSEVVFVENVLELFIICTLLQNHVYLLIIKSQTISCVT